MSSATVTQYPPVGTTPVVTVVPVPDGGQVEIDGDRDLVVTDANGDWVFVVRWDTVFNLSIDWSGAPQDAV